MKKKYIQRVQEKNVEKVNIKIHGSKLEQSVERQKTVLWNAAHNPLNTCQLKSWGHNLIPWERLTKKILAMYCKEKKFSVKSLFLTAVNASLQKAMEMKRANISSVDRVDHRMSRETSNSEYMTRKKLFQSPTAQYMAWKSSLKSLHM